MKWQILLIFYFFIAKSKSDDPSNCQKYITIDDGSVWESNVYIAETIDDDSSLNKQFPLTGEGTVVVTVVADTGSGSDYIDAVVDNDILIFRTYANFSNFDENTPKQTSNTITITAAVQLQCESSTAVTPLSFVLTIRDKNNHAPEFQQAVYAYSMPMPLVPRIDLTSLGDEIIARDLDFSNQDVTFTVDSTSDEYWELETSSSATSKDYRAILKVSQFTRIAGERTLTLTATDSGSPPLSSTAQIKITIDEDYSLAETPTFSAPTYTFTYSTNEDGTPSLSSTDKITITATNKNDIKVTLEENDYFEAKYDTDADEVKLTAKTAIKKLTANAVVVLTLEVSLGSDTGDIGKSVVMIYVPSLSDVPVFSQFSYWFNYSEADNQPILTVVTDSIEVISNYPDDTQVSIDGSVLDNFLISYNKDTNGVELTATATVDPKSGSILTFPIIVYLKSYPDYKSRSTVLINIPSEYLTTVPTFSKVYYTANYILATDPDTLDTVTLTEDITVTENAGITLESDYKDHFSFTCSDTGCTLKLESNLPTEALGTKAQTLLVLKATKTESPTESTTATVIVNLPLQQSANGMKFSSLLYTATYVDDQTVKLDEQIKIDNVDVDTVDVTIDDDSFSLTASDDHWDLGTTGLSIEILNTKVSLSYTITATQKDDPTITAKTGLVINLPKKENSGDGPSFTREVYTGDFLNSGETIVTLDYKMALSNSSIDLNTVDLTIDPSELRKYFGLTLNEDHWDLTVDNFSEDTVDTTALVLTITAAIPDQTSTGQTSVVVRLPKKISPTSAYFEKNVYEATYVQDPTDNITVSGDINIIRDTEQKAEVTVIGEYQDFFKADYESGKVTVSVKSPLSDEIINTQTVISVTLQAKLDTDVVLAAIIVTLPKAIVPEVLTFSQMVYSATYAEDKSVTLDEDIKIDNVDPSDVTAKITAGDNAESFSLKISGDHWEVTSTGLEQDLIDKEISILLTITAYKTEDDSIQGTAGLVINLPKKENSGDGPSFTKEVYTGDFLNSGETIVTLDHNIALSNSSIDLNTVSLTIDPSELREYFGLTLNGDHWDLTILDNLPEETIDTKAALVLTITATISGQTGQTTVVVRLPKKISPTSVYFDKSVYEATYDQGSTDKITVSGDINILQDSDKKAVVTVTEEYQEFFQADYDSGKVTVSLKSPLSDEILNTQAVISVTLKAELDTDVVLAAIIVTLPKATVPEVLTFSQMVYSATYAEDKSVTLDEIIKITNVDPSDVTAEITGDNAKYFDLTASDDHWELTSTGLTQELIDEEISLLLTITAYKTEDKSIQGTAGLVINLPKKEGAEQIVSFTSDLYQGAYLNSGETIIELDGVIALKDESIDIADVDTSVTSSVTSTTFELKANTDHWDLVIGNIPEDIVDTEAAIILTLKATISGQTSPSETAVVVTLPKKIASPTAVNFENNVYFANYEQDDGSITLSEDINIVNDVEGKASISVAETYAEYIAVEYKSGKVALTMSKPFTDDILDGNSVISVTLKAEANDESSLTALVIKLPSTYEEVPKFGNDVYQGSYLDNSIDVISLDQNIALADSSIDLTTVTTEITKGDKYEFNLIANGNHWDLKVVNLDSDLIDTEVALVLTITATIPGQASPAEATVILTLPKKISSTSIYFEENVYMADYITGSKNKIDVDGDIKISRDSDNTALVSITGDYKEYFTATYDDGEVTVTLSKSLSSDILSKNAAISVTIKAEKDGESALAALVVTLPKSQDNNPTTKSDSGDNTGLIAGVAVLAVLLVASLVGSAVFYYLKFKRGSSYDNMDDSNIEHFRKHSNPVEAVERPTRRPTGFIKFPLDGGVITETADDVPIDTRKSVQFDTVNIDELEVEPEQPDEDEIEDNIYYTVANEDNSSQT